MDDNQIQAVLKVLKTEGKITSIEAIERFGATRLSGIIFKLRKTYNIVSIKRTTQNRYGNTCNYVEYWYQGAKNEA